MTIPKIMGFPMWIGKTHMRKMRRWVRWGLDPLAQSELSGKKVGDLINDCSGFNVRIKDIEPEYFSFARSLQMLGDISVVSTTGAIYSLRHCITWPTPTRDQCEKTYVEFARDWIMSDAGEHWYGKGTKELEAAVKRAQEILDILGAGGHIADPDGVLLPEFRDRARM